MDTRLTEEQKMLQDSAAKFCQSEINMENVRELADDPVGLPDDLWNKIAEQGWLGIVVPEEHGGLGLGVSELGVVCEELGRALVPGPFVSTVLATRAITLGGSEALKKQWLETIVGGGAKATLALLEKDGELGHEAVHCQATKSGEGYILSGAKYLVPDAAAADLILVAARHSDGVSLFAVPSGASGVTIKPNKLTDSTSRNAQVYLDAVTVDADAMVSGGWDVVEDTLLAANVCIAADSVAGAEYILRLTVGYAKERTQFGKLIGSFQAVKHPLVDCFAAIESARSAYHYGAWAVDAESEDRRCAAAVARITATEAYRKTTLDCLQAHGGVAFTWEYDLHLYLKRAKHNQYIYGIPSDYEETIVSDGLAI